METASSPILYTLRFGGGSATSTSAAHAASTAKVYYHLRRKSPSDISLLASSENCRCSSLCGRFQKKLRFGRLICDASSQIPAERDQSQKFAVLIEVEGCVFDCHFSDFILCVSLCWISCFLWRSFLLLLEIMLIHWLWCILHGVLK